MGLFKKINNCLRSIFYDEFSEMKKIKSNLEKDNFKIKEEISKHETMVSSYNGNLLVNKHRQKDILNKQAKFQAYAEQGVKEGTEKGLADARLALKNKKELIKEYASFEAPIKDLEDIISKLNNYLRELRETLSSNESLIRQIDLKMSVLNSRTNITNNSYSSYNDLELSSIKEKMIEMDARIQARKEVNDMAMDKKDQYAFLDDNVDEFNIEEELNKIKSK